MPLSITILTDPSRLSLNQRLHWRERKRRNDAAKSAAYLGWLDAGRPTLDGPVTMDVLVRRGRVMDEDNIITGLKGTCDALVKCGLLSDDKASVLTWGSVTQETGRKWRGREEVVLTFTKEAANEQ